MKQINKLVNKYPWLIILVTLIITVFFGYQARNIDVDTDIKEMFPQGHSALETFTQVSDDYGGAEYVIVLLRDENILKPSSLENISSLTNQLEEFSEFSRVRSITNIEEVKGQDSTIDVSEFMEKIPQTEDEAQTFKDELANKDRYMGSLVGEDFNSAAIFAQLKLDADQQQLVDKVDALIEDNGFSEEVFLTGSPVFSQRLADIIISDILQLLPLVSLMVLLILFVSFKSLRGTILPIAVVLLSVIWTIGLIAWSGNTLSQLSSVLPVLLISVGSAYAIHLLARYYEDLIEGSDEKAAISNSIIYVGAAIAMAGVTTMAGFASLGLSELTIIQEFGYYTTFGVFSALLLSTTFLPAVLLKLKSPSHYQAAAERPWLDKMFSKLYQLVVERSIIVLSVAVIIIILSIIAIPQIVPETNYITFFEEESSIYQANQLIDEKMGGGATFEIIINSGRENGAEDVDFLEKVQTLQTDLEEHDLLSNPMSVIELLSEANIAMHEGDQEFDRLPESGIAQYYMLLSSGSNILNDFIDFNHQEVRLRISVAEVDESQKLSDVIAYTQDQISQVFPEYEFYSREAITPGDDVSHPYVTLTGVPVLTDVISGLIITGQIWSLLGAVVLAFIVTSLLLKSPLKGFACSLPVAFTVLFNFGLMGWTAVTLNVATSMIASIAVGIGVDYGIHFYTRYLEEIRKESDLRTAIKKAMFTVGRANFFNATAVMAGFLVLLLSSVPPLRKFGVLTSITMLVSFLGAMLILPALLMVKEKVVTALDRNKGL